MKKVVVHATETFHADDVFASASLQLLFNDNVLIERTQDEKKREEADIVIDIGFEYNPETNRFDHHQRGGAGERENGVPYSSVGLVWKHYGEEICGSKEVSEIIDKKLIQTIDGPDNGFPIYEKIIDGVSPYTISALIASYKPTWKEEGTADERFFEAVKFAKALLLREIERAKATLETVSVVEDAYEKSEDKRIIIFDEDNDFSDSDRISTLIKYEEPIYIVRPDKERGSWRIKAVPKEYTSFELRKPLPESWGGKKDEELAEITGVKDAQFCHRGFFTASATSKEGAIEMAKIALNS